MTTPLRPVLLTRPVAWKDRAEFATRASMRKSYDREAGQKFEADLMPMRGGKSCPGRLTRFL